MNNKISHLKWLQRTTPDGTRTLSVPPTTVLFMWFQNAIHFAVMEGTQTT